MTIDEMLTYLDKLNATLNYLEQTEPQPNPELELIKAKLQAADELATYLETKQLTLVGQTLVSRFRNAGKGE